MDHQEQLSEEKLVKYNVCLHSFHYNRRNCNKRKAYKGLTQVLSTLLKRATVQGRLKLQFASKTTIQMALITQK